VRKMDKYEVAVLAEDYARKRLAFECCQVRNIAGLTPEERIESSVAYHVAEAEMLEAYSKLNAAKNSPTVEPSS
jgi:hypothetical protein